MYHQLAQFAKEVVLLGASGLAAYNQTVAAFNNLLSFRPGSAAVATQSIGNAIIRPLLPKSAAKNAVDQTTMISLTGLRLHASSRHFQKRGSALHV